MTTAYIKLDDRNHVLKRTSMYIGSSVLGDYDDYVYEDDMIIKKTIQASNGLLRVFLEPLYNAVDNKERSKKEDIKMSRIDINIDKETNRITIKNDGAVIPIEMHKEEKCNNHTLLFSHFKTSSNYNDDSKRENISGVNGLGVKLTNIFSKEFTVSAVDPNNKKSFSQTWKNNMEIVEAPIITKSSLKKGYTSVSFILDLPRFGLTKLTDDIINLFHRYVIDVAMITGISTYYNNELVKTKTLLQYAKLFSKKEEEVDDNVEEKTTTTMSSKTTSTASKTSVIKDKFLSIETEDCNVILTQSSNSFEAISFVNGCFTISNGIHVNSWAEVIFRPIVDKFNSKNKDSQITINDVKKFFRLFVVCCVDKPVFESQSKHRLDAPKIKAVIDEKKIKSILRWPIIDEIENLIFNKDLKKLKLTERKKGFVKIEGLDDANNVDSKKGTECSLILCEGLSAKTFAVQGISQGVFNKKSRDWFGIYPLRGKILNVRNVKLTKIIDNKVVQNIVNAIGLQYNTDYTVEANFKKLRYGRVICLFDQDTDGMHIGGLLLNIFDTLFPTVFLRNKSFITCMQTPVVRAVKVEKGKDKLFYNLQDFEDFKKSYTKNFVSKYYKGLGTSSQKEVKETFGKKMNEYVYDKDAKKSMEKAFDVENADIRKKWIGETTTVKPLIWKKADDAEIQQQTITHFIDNQLVLYSRDNCVRCIPFLIDGLKESQRKVLCGAMMKNLDTEMKVSQLAGYISEHTDYHHGENNLLDTIIKMAQTFINSNNIPYFTQGGNFGSRISNGDDAASARYIFTSLQKITKIIFNVIDENIIEYNYDGEIKIEPKFYIPILPMILINGAQGIGTGWSTNIPLYNPKDMIELVKEWIETDDLKETEILPFYNGFKGHIYKKDKIYTTGILQDNVITEIPIGMSIDGFKEILIDLQEQKKINSFINKSDTDTIYFEVIPSDGFIVSLESLKLISTISTSNMVLFDTNNIIRKYNTIFDIIKEFCEFRLPFYDKRKEYLLGIYKPKLEMLKNKKRFLTDVISGTYSLSDTNKKSKSVEVMNIELEKSKFLKINNSFDYLLDLNIKSMTSERVLKLEKEISELEKLISDLEPKTNKMLWLEDLELLKNDF